MSERAKQVCVALAMVGYAVIYASMFIVSGCVTANPEHNGPFDDHVHERAGTGPDASASWGETRGRDRCGACPSCCGVDSSTAPPVPTDPDAGLTAPVGPSVDAAPSPDGALLPTPGQIPPMADATRWGGSLACHRFRDVYALACGSWGEAEGLTCPWLPTETPATFDACLAEVQHDCTTSGWTSACAPARRPVDYCAQYTAAAARRCNPAEPPPCPFVNGGTPYDWGSCIASFRIAEGCLLDDREWHGHACAVIR